MNYVLYGKNCEKILKFIEIIWISVTSLQFEVKKSTE